MKFKFDANQEFQINAIEAVTDLFQGQGYVTGNVLIDIAGKQSFLAAVSNRLDLEELRILDNLNEIQVRNNISPDSSLECIEENIATASGKKISRFFNFSVEMETGTGKTYVYLRTILELNRCYGMCKFIIVVPSVAIREGVLKTLKVTEGHFKKLYENPVYRYYVYDSSNLTQIRQFSLSDSVEVMIMTIQSFNKAANVIRQTTDRLQGETPIHLVQITKPVLILDEPQNMESELSKASLSLLNPIFALRYSATHRNPYNVVYRLTPSEAYRNGLVKKIEVDSVVQEHDANRPFLCVEDIKSQKRTITAKVSVHKLQKDGQVKRVKINVKPGDSLREKTKRPEYEGFEIDEIDVLRGFVRFSNNQELKKGESFGMEKEDIFRVQIRQTILQHFDKQKRLRVMGVKDLSLFFIDRVSNYTGDDNKPGLIRKIFNEEFNHIKEKYSEWKEYDPDQVQAAYFAQKKRKSGDIELLDSKTGESADDAIAYELIMKKKEELLAFPSPNDNEETQRDRNVSFIFSHSALREGWDNPNIFQICTLNHTSSLVKKRQEVGRGVRLAVNQKGDRVFDEKVNILTVIANESYRDYVENYQSEIAFEYRSEIEARYGKPISDLSDKERRIIEEEYGEGILPPPPRKAGQRKARLRKARILRDDFKELWERIKHKTRYRVKINTEELLAGVKKELEKIPISIPRISITKASVDVNDTGMFEAMQMSAAKTAMDLSGRYPFPNIVSVMENMMEYTSPPMRLTRKTLLDVFNNYEPKKSVLDNPHEWASIAVKALKEILADHIIEGIQYEKINEWYEMTQILSEEEVEIFKTYIANPDEINDKTIYDMIPCDSKIEYDFVKGLEAREDVLLYVKLPYWFKVKTPVGDYNPDWAIVMKNTEEENRKPLLYLVRETKSEGELRPAEEKKTICGKRHFEGALGVSYRVVTNSGDLP